MEREAAISELPTAHAVAIRLRDNGADDATVAAALGIDAEEVPPLVTIAEAKLEALLVET
jgi:hypothetical protein